MDERSSKPLYGRRMQQPGEVGRHQTINGLFGRLLETLKLKLKEADNAPRSTIFKWAGFIAAPSICAALWAYRLAGGPYQGYSTVLTCIAIGGGALALALIHAALVNINFKVTPNAYHGSAGFAEHEDIADLIVDSREPSAPGSFMVAPIAPEGRLELHRTLATRHVIILGPTGSGKTRSFFLPNCSSSKQASFVATDPKGELWQHTSGNHPHPVRYAPREPDASECLNWIPLCTDPHLTLLLARAVMESDGASRTDPFWIHAESAFLAAIFAHARTLSEPTPATAYDLIASHSQSQLIEALKNSESPLARQFSNTFLQGDPKLRGGVVIGVASRLVFLADPLVRRFTSATITPPDFGEMRERATGIYWVLQENDVALLKPLSTLFFTLLLYQLKQRDPVVPVSLYLDELANIGRLPEFASEITVARGRDISFVLGVQSLSQLNALYGDANAHIIIDACQSKIALSGLASDSAELVSRELGETTISAMRMSATMSDKPSHTYSQQDVGRRLLTADEVRRIQEDELIVIVTNRRPLLLKRFHYSSKPNPASTTQLGAERTTPFALPIEDELMPPPPLPT